MRAKALNRITAIRDKAKAESRDLTDAELQETMILRDMLDEGEGENITREENDANGNRPPVVLEDVTRTGTAPRDPVATVAREFVDAAKNGQSIRREILLPTTDWHGSARAVAGDPTDVLDLAPLFVLDTLTSQFAPFLRFDATVAGVVAEGAPKPDIVTAELESDKAQKVAGIGIVSAEVLQFVQGTEAALRAVLTESIYAGQNKIIATKIEGGATAFANTLGAPINVWKDAAGTAITNRNYDGGAVSTFLSAVAKVSTKTRNVVALINSADYFPLATFLANMPAQMNVPEVVVSDDVTAGQAIVAARSAVHVSRTAVFTLLDPYTKASVNKTQLICEMFVAVSVVRPTLVLKADLTV